MYTIPGYQTFHKPTTHGLAVFVTDKCQCSMLSVHEENIIEIMAIHLISLQVMIVLVYKPPTQSSQTFQNYLTSEVQKLMSTHKRIIILGDFNNAPTQMLEHQGFTQLIHHPTHQLGGILDLILTNYPVLFPVPYTDHFLTWASS